MSTPGFWQERYAAGEDGWDLGGPAPPLSAWLDGGGTFPAAAPGRPARVAVPGAGRGHDARLLARRGYAVTAVDFAPAALAEAARLAAAEGLDLAVEGRDVFTLADTYRGAFDGVWEYTCYCAIDPARRAEYVAVLGAILRPGGRLLACFFPMRAGTDGPPFPVAREEVEALLAPAFAIERAAAPARSAGPREGLEWLVAARRR